MYQLLSAVFVRVFCVCLFVLLSSSPVFSQELPPSDPAIESCFAYYDYGKVGVHFGTDKQTYAAGETVTLSGTLENTNTHPLTNLTVYALVRREAPQAVFDRHGHYLIDRVRLADRLTLAAEESRFVTLSLPLPVEYPSGTYEVQFFIFSGEGFHYAGRPFMDEDIAGSVTFSVSGQNPSYLDPETLTVNGETHTVREAITLFPSGPLAIAATLSTASETAEAYTVSVRFYAFDDAIERNLIKEESVLIRPRDNNQFRIAFAPPTTGAFVMVAQMDSPARSILKYRFAVDGNEAPRLHMGDLGISAFPPEETDRAWVCFHSPTNRNAPETTVILTLLDKDSQLLEEKRVAGVFPPDIQAISIPLAKVAGLKEFRVRTAFEQNGETVRATETSYTCDLFDSSIKTITVGPEASELRISATTLCGSEIASPIRLTSAKLYSGDTLVAERHNVTPENGKLTFPSVAPGTYRVEVSSPYGTQSSELTIVAGSSAKRSPVRIVLFSGGIVILIVGGFWYYKKRLRARS